MDKTRKILCIIDTCSLVYLKDVQDALGRVNSQTEVLLDSEKKLRRLAAYNQKVERIAQVLSQIKP